MTTVVLTPWEDESELAMVRDWFYPQHAPQDPYSTRATEDMRTEAVARVNVWTFKSSRVSTAAVCTADLTDSIVNCETMSKSQNMNSYRAVQFMFAFAFLRFVNGFVDRDVSKAATATLAVSEDDEESDVGPRGVGESSMYAHAVTIGMPSRFVDLRHQVVHGNVPDVRRLQTAAIEALEWLWEKWWKTNATGDASKALRRHEARRQLREERSLG